MMGEFVAENVVDVDGNPTGGKVNGIGIEILWQDGPLGRDGERVDPNGAFIETVIAAVVNRIEFFQQSKFRCRENAIAITKLEEALHWLNARTNRREKVGIEGTYAEEAKVVSA